MISYSPTRGRALFRLIFKLPLPLLLVLSSASVSCDLGPSVVTPKDFSDFRRSFPDPVYWVDNDQLVFLGFKREGAGSKSVDKDGSAQQLSLYIIDVRTGRAQTYAERTYPRFCYSRGYIAYGKQNRDGKTFTMWAGKLGEEQESQELTEQIIRKGRGLGNVACRYLDEEVTYRQARNASYRILKLYPEHGFLEFQIQGYLPDQPILYHKTGESEPMEIQGYKATDAMILLNQQVEYYPFKEAYFMWSSKAWWLYPDGKTEPQPLPRGPWDECYRTCAHFTPTKTGMLVNYFLRGSERLLLMQGDNVHTVTTRRMVGRETVSPNGCLVAFNYVADTPKPMIQEWSIAVVDVCGRGES
jgi:hypothetical protein